MDFEAIWQTHKPFILRVLGGAVVFLILTGVRSSIASGAAATSRQNASQQAAILDKLSQLKNAEGLQKGRAKALAEKLEPALASTLLWAPDPAYVLPEGETSPALFYSNARHLALSKVERHASRWNAQVPKGGEGLGLRDGVPPGEVPEALAVADLVHRVVLKLLDAGVREISSVSPEEARYQARKGDTRFLRELPVSVSFDGDVRLLAKVLAAFQNQGEFLQVGDCKVDLTKTGVSVTLSLIGLTLVDKRPDGAAPAARPRGGAGGTRGPRRVRKFGRER